MNWFHGKQSTQMPSWDADRSGEIDDSLSSTFKIIGPLRQLAKAAENTADALANSVQNGILNTGAPVPIQPVKKMRLFFDDTKEYDEFAPSR